jgi:hypothetical protein
VWCHWITPTFLKCVLLHRPDNVHLCLLLQDYISPYSRRLSSPAGNFMMLYVTMCLRLDVTVACFWMVRQVTMWCVVAGFLRISSDLDLRLDWTQDRSVTVASRNISTTAGNRAVVVRPVDLSLLKYGTNREYSSLQCEQIRMWHFCDQ